MQKITCCKGCVPPKRFIGCHGTDENGNPRCPEYAAEKKAWEALKQKMKEEQSKELMTIAFHKNKMAKIAAIKNERNKK